MKILHINTAITGGAAIAALRIHQGLLNQGYNSSFMSLDKKKEWNNYICFNEKLDNLLKPEKPILTFKNYLNEKLTHSYKKKIDLFNVKLKEFNEKYTIEFNKNSFEIFSSPYSNYDLTQSEAYKRADIIHLHWVAGYIDYSSFFEKNKKPVVWTLHDENPFRGGFHYKQDEDQNNLHYYQALDNLYKKIKLEAINKHEHLSIVTPSKWLKDAALASDIFSNRNVKQIYYTLNQSIFKPWDKNFSKEFFKLPSNKLVFMFVAQHVFNKRKGFDLLEPIILKNLVPNAHYFIVGENKNNLINENVTFTGTISDERIMALAYSSADCFVLPSREDNLPNTMLESLSCGTPLITFPIGDFKELIQENLNGIVVDDISTEALKKGMIDFAEKRKFFPKERIRAFALNNFGNKKIVDQYVSLYNEMLAKK